MLTKDGERFLEEIATNLLSDLGLTDLMRFIVSMNMKRAHKPYNAELMQLSKDLMGEDDEDFVPARYATSKMPKISKNDARKYFTDFHKEKRRSEEEKGIERMKAKALEELWGSADEIHAETADAGRTFPTPPQERSSIASPTWKDSIKRWIDSSLLVLEREEQGKDLLVAGNILDDTSGD